MKTFLTLSLILTLLIGVTGCAPMSLANRVVILPAATQPGDVIETAIDVARELGFPPATKIDKQNGLVEFGGFGMPELGITAQVRVKSENQIELTVQRGSEYIPLKADDKADQFAAKLKERLKGTEVQVVK